jgi:hypothetical protein
MCVTKEREKSRVVVNLFNLNNPTKLIACEAHIKAPPAKAIHFHGQHPSLSVAALIKSAEVTLTDEAVKGGVDERYVVTLRGRRRW